VCTTLVAELLQDVRLDGNVTGLRDVIGEVMGKVMVINDTMFNVYYQDVSFRRLQENDHQISMV